MPPIRELFFAIMVLFIMVFGAVLFVGGTESVNGVPLSPLLAPSYNAINVNHSYPTNGVFANTSGTFAATNGLATNVSNVATTSSSGGIINSVSLVIGYLSTIPLLYTALINFIALPIAALGIQIGYATTIAQVILTGIIALAIVSAIFLFPISVYSTTAKVKKTQRFTK